MSKLKSAATGPVPNKLRPPGDNVGQSQNNYVGKIIEAFLDTIFAA